MLVQIWIKTSYYITATTESLTRKKWRCFTNTKKPLGKVTLKKQQQQQKKVTYKCTIRESTE